MYCLWDEEEVALRDLLSVNQFGAAVEYISVEGENDARRKVLTMILLTTEGATETKQQELRVDGQMKWAGSPTLDIAGKRGIAQGEDCGEEGGG